MERSKKEEKKRIKKKEKKKKKSPGYFQKRFATPTSDQARPENDLPKEKEKSPKTSRNVQDRP